MSSGASTVLGFFELSTEESDYLSIIKYEYTVFIPDYTQLYFGK
jgi:hypothetical protein